ncbi:MAG: DUF1801 domain-containing protein [Planctomycetes bacterium]|nr:DUF1801 domain-containing protein [Planctomycetota bacterium]
MVMPATTVDQYLATLPEDRRAALNAVRAVFKKNLDKDIQEGMQYGMIGYYVPHSVFPAGYHCDPKQPLPYAGLSSRKSHMSVHLMSVYIKPSTRAAFEAAWKKSGKKLDMGAACIRFKKLEDLPLDVLGDAIKAVTAADYIAHYESNLAKSRSGKARKAGKPAKARKRK